MINLTKQLKTNGFVKSYIHEICLSLSFLDDFYKVSFEQYLKMLKGGYLEPFLMSLSFEIWKKEDLLSIIKIYEKYIKVMKKVNQKGYKDSLCLDEEYKNLKEHKIKYTHILLDMSINMKGIGRKNHIQNTQIRMILTVLEIEKYYIKHKKYPSRLDEIISRDFPELLLDPFSDKSLIYIKNNDRSYKLYSVGSDMIDNGGIKRKGKKLKIGEDIVFSVEKE